MCCAIPLYRTHVLLQYVLKNLHFFTDSNRNYPWPTTDEKDWEKGCICSSSFEALAEEMGERRNSGEVVEMHGDGL